ncbi:MAG: hypothetical protein NC350_00045 [Corallococcus sp.]|nr:hypothetical protein [Corallococcus sp.]
MAKKKQKIDIGLIMIGVAAILGLAAVCMMFLPSYIGTGKVLGSQTSFTGLQSAFGYTESSSGSVSVSSKILDVNILATLGFLLPVAGVIIAAIFRSGKMFTFIAAGVFIASGIMVLLSGTTFPATVMGSEIQLYNWSLGVGAILSGVFSLLAGLTLLAKVFLKK